MSDFEWERHDDEQYGAHWHLMGPGGASFGMVTNEFLAHSAMPRERLRGWIIAKYGVPLPVEAWLETGGLP